MATFDVHQRMDYCRMGAAIDRGIGVLCMLVHELAGIITYEIVKLIIFSPVHEAVCWLVLL